MAFWLRFANGGGTPTPTPGVPTLVVPGGAWNGTAQSGYSGSPPTLTGTTYGNRLEYTNMLGTVCPITHFLHPAVSDEMFTDDYTVVMSAFAAAAGGGVVGGVASVDFFVEGTTTNVTTLGVYQLPAYGGGTVPVLGYAITLDHSAFALSGGVDIYARANPSLAGVTARTIGPMRLYRKTGYDKVIDIDPGQAVVTGSRYQTVQGAWSYINTNFVTNQHWQLRNIADGEVNVDVVGFTTSGTQITKRGQIVIDANGHTCTIRKTSWTDTTGSDMRPGMNGIVWLGYKFDATNVGTYYVEGNTRLHVFRNCEIYSSGPDELPGNPNHLLPGGPGVGKTGRFFQLLRTFVSLEACYVHDIGADDLTTLVQIGCRIEDIAGDSVNSGGAGNGPYIVVGNRYKRISGKPLANRLPSISVAYAGAGTPTIDITGGHDGSGRAVVLKVNGTAVKTVQASTTVASGNYNNQDAVNDINAFGSGWSATLLDDTRRFASIGHSSGTFPTSTVSGLTLPCTLSTAFDIHCDGFQLVSTVDHENVISMNNMWVDCEAQMKFWTSSNNVWNVADIQNGRQYLAFGGLNDPTIQQSAESGARYHSLSVNNTNANQRWGITHDTGNTTDAFCRFVGNVATIFESGASAVTPWDMYASGNIAFGAPTAALSGTNITTPIVSGTGLANFPQVGSVPFAFTDFVPTVGQSVRANLIPTQLPYDIFGAARSATCPPGIAA